MYNFVDSAYVSNKTEKGEAALNSLTLAFPMQMLMIAVSIGTGVGVNALVSKSLGQGDTEKASRTAGNGGFLAVLIFLLCVFFGIFGVAPYIHLQTKDFLIADMGISYLRICCMLSMGIIFFSIYEKLLQASGNPIFSTIAQSTCGDDVSYINNVPGLCVGSVWKKLLTQFSVVLVLL